MKKKILTILLALAAVIPASAQFDCGYFEIRAGYRGYLGEQCFGTSLNGAYIGTNFNFDELMGPIDLGLGINFNQVIKSKVQGYALGTETLTMLARDLQFPLYVRARFPIGKAEMYFKVGPTFNCGLTLDVRDDQKWAEFSGNKRYSFYDDKDSPWKYRRFDVIIDSGLGFIFGERFAIQAGFGYGCIPRCTQDAVYDEKSKEWIISGTDSKSHNMQLSVGLSYGFK